MPDVPTIPRKYIDKPVLQQSLCLVSSKEFSYNQRCMDSPVSPRMEANKNELVF